MRRADVEAFLKRPWARLRRGKEEYISDRIERLGLTEAFRLADELRRSAFVLGGRPDLTDRDEDLATHIRVHRLLERAGARRRH